MNDLVLQGGTVWDGRGAVLEGHDVVIRGGTITEVRPASRTGGDLLSVECEGRWVMPGLIDCHMHFFGARTPDPVRWCLDSPIRSALRATVDARKVLEAGFTTVRDAGSRNGIAIRDAIRAGEVVGPRVSASGFGISRTGGHGDVHSLPLFWVKSQPFMAYVVDGPEECRRAVRMIARAGADWVKIWATGGVLSERDDPRHTHLTPEELATIVAEAHDVGLPVGAHCEGLDGTKACVEAGVDSIEHGFFLDEEVCHAMSARGIPLVTTLSFLHRTAENRGGQVPAYALDKARDILEQAMQSVRIAYECGVEIALGTDTFAEPLTPFGRNAEELICLIEAGIPIEVALRAATSSAAKVLRRSEELGQIAPGYIGDVLVLNASPLDDVTVLTRQDEIALVIAGGRIVAGTEAPRGGSVG